MAENTSSRRAHIKEESREYSQVAQTAREQIKANEKLLNQGKEYLSVQEKIKKLQDENVKGTLEFEQVLQRNITSTTDHIENLVDKIERLEDKGDFSSDKHEKLEKQLKEEINLSNKLKELYKDNAESISEVTRKQYENVEQAKQAHKLAVQHLNVKQAELQEAEENLKIQEKSSSIDDEALKAAKEKVKTKKEEVAAAKGAVTEKENKLKKESGEGGNWADSLKGTGVGGDLLSSLFGKDKDTTLYDAFANKKDGITDGLSSVMGDQLGDALTGAMGPVVKALDIAANAMSAIALKLDEYVTQAAKVLSSTQGATNAYLYGYRTTGDSGEAKGGAVEFNPFGGILERSRAYLGGSTIVTQTEYLDTIKSIASQGIAQGLETAALLTTLAEKTVPQFNATSDAVRRLVLLQEEAATQRFFGLESLIQRTLNHQFGETSYLNKLFDSVNSNLMDAMVQLGDKIGGDPQYSFLSTVQQWLSYLYEQGVDQNTVSKISTTLNALGSGNISQVASDSGMQKLMLLSMDKANMDYATILQNGLSAEAVNTLMSSMVDYLKGIVKTTGSNNVLESAYANMFGLSMTDMAALRDVRTPGNAPVISQMEKEAQNRLLLSGTASFTHLSEKLENISSNAQFDFGSRIAENPGKYGVWRGAMLAMDIGKTIADNSMLIGKVVGKTIQGVAGFTALASAIGPAIQMIRDVKNAGKSALSGSNTVLDLYNEVSNSSFTSSSSKTRELIKALGDKEEKNQKSYDDLEAQYNAAYETAESEDGKDDEATRILKEVEKTLMKNTEGNHYAIAVSLQAMSDEVLRSFASIFADEDSMEGIFKDKKTKNKLFRYDGDEIDSEDPTASTSDKIVSPQKP